jgi:hypothetical protein
MAWSFLNCLGREKATTRQNRLSAKAFPRRRVRQGTADAVRRFYCWQTGSRHVERQKIPFESPIAIRAGHENTVRHVKSVNGASEVMTDWPHARRGPVYQETVAVIEAALAGDASAAQARAAFHHFAEHAGVLVQG